MNRPISSEDIINCCVDDAFKYASSRENILSWMESDSCIDSYAEMAPDGDGIKLMQSDALGFEDSIIKLADSVIRELYRLDAQAHWYDGSRFWNH